MKDNYAKFVSRPVSASLFLGVALGAMCIPSIASAQDDGIDDTDFPDDAIIVTGLRAALEDALQIRRNADVVLDGISSDDIGSTPDLNLGEALQRIPGVQINRDGTRRDATISVRGLPGNFTKTTIQGQSVASTSRGLSFNAGSPFGIFDSSIFNGANVVKSFTSEVPSGGLAAVVDLRINSAFRRREGVVLRAEVNYEESTEKFTPAYFGSIAKKLTDRFAVYATGAYTDLNFRRDTIRINSYNAFTDAQVAGFADGSIATGLGSPDTISGGPNPAFDIAPVGENGLPNRVIFANTPGQVVQQDRGYRFSGAAGFAYEVTDDLVFRVDGIFTRRELDGTTQDNLQLGVSGNNTLTTPLSNPVFLGVLDFNLDGIEENVFHTPRVFASDANVSHANRFLPAVEESFAIYPQFNFENDDWRLDIIGTYSEAFGIEQLTNIDFRSNQQGGRADANLNGIDDRGTQSTVVVDSGLGDLNQLLIDAQFDPRLLNFDRGDPPQDLLVLGQDQGSFRLNRPGLAVDNGNPITGVSRFLVQGFNSQVDRDLKAIDFKLARKFENSIINEIGIGAYYSQEDSDRSRINFGVLGPNGPALSGLAAEDVFIPGGSISSGAGLLGGEVPGAERDGFITLNIPLLRDTLLPVQRELRDGITFRPNAGNIRNALPELINDPDRPEVGATSITIDEILAAAGEVPNTGGFLERVDTNNFQGVGRFNFSASRDNLELFAVTKFDLQNTTEIPLRGNFGLRYVRTDLNGLARNRGLEFIDRVNDLRAAAGTPLLELRAGALDPEPADVSLSNLLPSVNLIYDITDNFTVRAAYYETFEAFDLAEFQPTPTTIIVSEPGEDPEDINNNVTTTNVTRSSLDVQPRSSKGFDIGFSWYNRPGSLVALGFFRKTLENDIVSINNFCDPGASFTVLGQTFNDLQRDVNENNRCTFDPGGGAERERIRIRFSANNPEDITVTGFEGQIQQNLDFLPGPLGNTGFIINATRVRVDSANDAVLTRVADFTYNLIGYYEDKLFQARLAWNHQGDVTLPDGGSFGGGSRFQAARGQLDFSGAIRPAKGFEVRFELFNITKSARREFLAVDELFRRYDFDGRTVGLSATYRFN